MSEPSGDRGRHPAIVADVARIFRANGYHGTTMSVVSEQTGLGKSSIYHHFGRGKLEMAQRSLDVVETFMEAMEAAAGDTTASAGARWATIAQMLRAYYEDGQLGCLLAVFSLEDVPDDLRTRTKRLFDRWRAAMARLCTPGDDADAQLFALRSVMTIQGGLVMSRAQSSGDAFDHALAEVASAVSELP